MEYAFALSARQIRLLQQIGDARPVLFDVGTLRRLVDKGLVVTQDRTDRYVLTPAGSYCYRMCSELRLWP